MVRTVKTLAVAAIKSGTVIDHIEAGRALKILNLLKLTGNHRQIMIAMNLPGGSQKIKDIIKLEGMRLTDVQEEKIAVISPEATINTIEEYEVIEKKQLILPTFLQGIIRCPNGECICNHDRMDSFFFIEIHCKNIRFRCKYCRKYCPDNLVFPE